ncbi:MAG: low molecular weight phosphotyrosine protein phosphatase [Anaerolineae bacterium]|nr:low molecular weight phosphotyrosine protein phosphatase [Anaerolineae bacterium]
MIGVLFVCAGNICRSPMAEAVFAQQVQQAGLAQQFRLDSAGTGGWHVGEPADSRTLAVLRREKIPYHGRARQLQPGDLTAFNVIVAMDQENLAGILALAHKHPATASIRLFLDAARAAGQVDTAEVPDPYYNNQFDRVYDLVTAGGAALLAQLRRDADLA